MTESGIVIVKESNLSRAWLAAMAAVTAPGVTNVVPLIVNISGFEGNMPAEEPGIRGLLDNALAARGKKFCAVDTTSNTIFPETLWLRHNSAGALEFFRRYREKLAPRLRRADHRNRKGTYFERLVNYRGIDQLERMLKTWTAGNHRTSALQAAIFDPCEDHTAQPFLGFPCLDHIAFASDGVGLSITAFYASHYIFDRAYGNYLGLCRLARFMGSELQLPFQQLTCVAGSAKMGTITKSEAAKLLEQCEASAVSPQTSAHEVEQRIPGQA